MNIQRFKAPTSREALAQARAMFGEGTLILSNRPTADGVEVLASAEDALETIEAAASSKTRKSPSSSSAPSANPSYKEVAAQVQDDVDQLAMSTLSFQDYVRERVLRRRHEATQIIPAPEAPAPAPVHKPAPKAAVPPARKPGHSVPVITTVVDEAGNSPQPALAGELQAMKALIEERFNTLTWLGQARQNPVQSNLMLQLIRSGYSPALSRNILERLPESKSESQATQWISDVLERNLRTDENGPALHEQGGVFALIGATGVGKTTTTAKLAGLCARTYGPSSVGLITLDTYRMGAHEQLRSYGKLLGVVAHLAHDRAALQDLLGLLSNKKMVLIDTSGMAPRDPRRRELMELLNIPQIQKLLVLNAGAHGETIDESVTSFSSKAQQSVILSKTDEAVKLGPALDVAIRHQLLLRGITTGQRVPEDWESAQAARLVRQSLRTANSALGMQIGDLNFFFANSSTRSTSTASHA